MEKKKKARVLVFDENKSLPCLSLYYVSVLWFVRLEERSSNDHQILLKYLFVIKYVCVKFIFFPVSPTVFIDVGLSTYPGKTTQHSFIPIFIMGENIYYG